MKKFYTEDALKSLTYEDAQNYLNERSFFGMKLGLERMQAFLQLLDNPHKKCRFVHVAGTNGKGSVSVTLASFLAQSGLKVGLYTSPYITDFCERISLMDICYGILPIDKKVFASLFAEIIAVSQTNEQLNPSYFELITICAFLYFANMKCDVVVLEVGMGGRFDATNVIDHPLLSIITSISYDHMHYLGNNLCDIAYEKAGILKKGTPALIYDPFINAQFINLEEEKNKISEYREAAFYLADLCKKQGIDFEFLRLDNVKISIDNPDDRTFILQHCSLHPENFEYQSSLLGVHQKYNLALSILAYKLLWQNPISCAYLNLHKAKFLSAIEIAERSKKIYWPGRLEKISDNPFIIVDGAHNVAGVEVLSSSLNSLFADVEIDVLCGILKDKQVYLMLKTFLQQRKFKLKNLYLHEPCSDRALSKKEIYDLAFKFKDDHFNIHYIENLNNKHDLYDLCHQKRPMVVFGSLYLVSEIKSLR